MSDQSAKMNAAPVSVAAVITYFKAARFIDNCVLSVDAQTRRPDEFVIVDDEVSDGSSRVLGGLRATATVITHPRNLGVCAARNSGAQATSSQWIAYLDSDDSWYPEKLERQLAFIANHPRVAAVHTGMRVFCGDETLAEYTEKPLFLSIPDTLMMAAALPSSLMVRREVLESIGGWRDAAGVEDRDLCLRLLEAGHSIGFVAEPLVNFRREDHGNATSDWRSKLHKNLQFYRCHRRHFLDHGRTRAYLEWTFNSAAFRSQGLGKLGLKIVAICFSLLQGRLKPRG